MHISEGVLNPPVLLLGGIFTALGTAVGLKYLTPEAIPRAALLTAAAFVASLVHIPLGPSSVHLVLNGLLGLILRWGAFPSFLVCLFLQAILFQFGGLTTLGVNTFNMAFPAVVMAYLARPLLNKGTRGALVAGFLVGSLAVFGAGLLVALELSFTGENFRTAARLILAAHLPVAVLEGVICAFICSYLKRIRPEILR